MFQPKVSVLCLKNLMVCTASSLTERTIPDLYQGYSRFNEDEYGQAKWKAKDPKLQDLQGSS